MVAILMVFCSLVYAVTADINEKWTISYKVVHPDGVPKVVPVVNGKYPGPELRGSVNETVRIEVVNKLPTDSTSIHWHGIKQDGTPWSDGKLILYPYFQPFFLTNLHIYLFSMLYHDASRTALQESTKRDREKVS